MMQNSAPKVLVGPVVEPVTVEDIKTHLRIDAPEETEYLASLILAARLYIEQVTNRAFITQTLKVSLASFPCGQPIVLPRAPLQSVASLKYLDMAGVLQTLSPAMYIVNTDAEPGEVWPAPGVSWPSVMNQHPQAVQITYLAGYGDDAAEVPDTVKHAIRFLTAHWFANREPVNIGNITTELPFSIQSLINLIKIWSF